MAKSYGTKQQLEKEGGSFTAFKSGSYIAKLSKIEIKEKKNYDNDIVPTLCLQFAPYEANARTPVMKDIEGKTIKALSRVLFFDINKVTMGFRDNFTLPSKYRALVSALQDMDPNEDVPGPDDLTVESAYDQLEEFFGNYLVVSVSAVEKNGKYRNKITDFLPVPEDFEADPVVEAAKEDVDKKKASKSKSESSSSSRKSSKTRDEDEEVEEIEDKPEKKTRKAIF